MDKTFDKELEKILDNYTAARIYSAVENRVQEKRATIQIIKELFCSVRGCKPEIKEYIYDIRLTPPTDPCIHCGRKGK